MTKTIKQMGEDDPVSTHMPLARHDDDLIAAAALVERFYSHASCEA